MDTAIQNAVKFIGLELKENPDADRQELIEIASQKYDLNPMQQDFLINKYIFDK